MGCNVIFSAEGGFKYFIQSPDDTQRSIYDSMGSEIAWTARVKVSFPYLGEMISKGNNKEEGYTHLQKMCGLNSSSSPKCVAQLRCEFPHEMVTINSSPMSGAASGHDVILFGCAIAVNCVKAQQNVK